MARLEQLSFGISPRAGNDAGDSNTAGGGFYRLDLESGVFVRLFNRITPDHIRSRTVALWPDGRGLYALVKKTGASPWTSVVAVDLATGQERHVADFPSDGLQMGENTYECGLALSPDGHTLAISAYSYPSAGGIVLNRVRIFTIGTDGAHEDSHGLVTWTPDGKAILFAAMTDPGAWRVFRTSLDSSEVTADGVGTFTIAAPPSMPEFSVHHFLPERLELGPGGSTIAFDLRTEPVSDLWVIDDFSAWLAKRRK